MIELGLWCDDALIVDTIKEIIGSYDDIRMITEKRLCDVMLFDITQPEYSLPHIMSILEKINSKTILILMIDHSEVMLEIHGLYVYQYMLRDQLKERFPSCINNILSYLRTVSSICIHKDKEKYYIKIKEIYYIVYEEGIVFIGLSDQKIATQFPSLEKIMVQLDESFVFVNRNTIIQSSYVSKVTTTSVTLTNHITFSLSRRRKKTLCNLCENRRWSS